MEENKNKLPGFRDEQPYHKMVEEVQDYAILLLNKDGIVQNWNRGAEQIKGYTEKEIVGKSFSIFYLPEDQARALPTFLINQAAETGRAVHEGWRVRKDGTTFWGNVVITALHDDEDNVIGFTKVTRDLTERKLAEDQKERDAKSIALKNAQLEEFAYITSHDLQEPIRKIQTFIGIARKNLDDKEALQKYLEQINTSAEKMVTLIKEVLNFSRLSHSIEQFEVVDLNAVMRDVIHDFDLLIEEKNVQIHSPSLPVIQGIRVQMHQLFCNLISNAIKFNTEIPVITISLEPLTNKGIAEGETQLYQTIVISDNGIGFEQKYAEQAFQPFKRLTTDYSGTGIGLALCKRIVENHKGIIQVFSESGKGTTFKISLPVAITDLN